MASIRPSLCLVPKVIGRRQFSLSQRMRLKDNWDQEALPGSNVPFNSKRIFQLEEKNLIKISFFFSKQQMGFSSNLNSLRIISCCCSILCYALAIT